MATPTAAPSVRWIALPALALTAVAATVACEPVDRAPRRVPVEMPEGRSAPGGDGRFEDGEDRLMPEDGGWDPVGGGGDPSGFCIHRHTIHVAQAYTQADLDRACSEGIAAFRGASCLGGAEPTCLGHIIAGDVPGERSPFPSGSDIRAYVGAQVGDCHTRFPPCDADMVCTASGSCMPACDPADPAACPGGWCNGATRQCETCTGGSCPDGRICVNGGCFACDPSNPDSCASGFCDAATMTCKPCTEDGQCGAQICSYGDCTAPECQGSDTSSCPDDGEEYVCRDGRCVQGCDHRDDCSPFEDCIDGECTAVKQVDGQCPPPYVPFGTEDCRIPCTEQPSQCEGPVRVCDPQTGYCRDACQGCSGSERCQEDPPGSGVAACVDVCRDHVCDPGEECYVMGGGLIIPTPDCRPIGPQCQPGDLCCGAPCLPHLCDPATGMCQPDDDGDGDDGDGNDCVAACANAGMCSGWLDDCWCTSSSCAWDEMCTWDGWCSSGQTCVLDGDCEGDETCACDAACCGGGPGGSGSGGGESCSWCGGGSISYGQCYACGGWVEYGSGGAYCNDVAVAEDCWGWSF